jgi:hypothetical protein
VPQLDTYIGPETPNPLFITLLRSKHAMPTMESVLKDILGLTRINYNSCNYNDSLPVMVRFAKMVGEVLTMGSAKGSEKAAVQVTSEGREEILIMEYITDNGTIIHADNAMDVIEQLRIRARFADDEDAQKYMEGAADRA